jgi:lipoprotein signal peptidase
LLPREIREDQFNEWRDEIQCAKEHGLSAGRCTLSIVLRSIPQLAWRARRPSRIRPDRLKTAGDLGKRLPKSIQQSWALTTGRSDWTKALFIALAIALLDLGSKALVSSSVGLFEKQHPLPYLTIFHVQSPGLSLSFIDGGFYLPPYIFAVAATLMLLNFIAGPPQPRFWLIVGLLVGGVTGNVTERLYHDYVTDFLQVGAVPAVFNFADASIALAMFLSVLPRFRKSKSSAEQQYKSVVAANSVT